MRVEKKINVVRMSEHQLTGIHCAKTIIRTKMFNFAELLLRHTPATYEKTFYL
jgi:hypothetical protein